MMPFAATRMELEIIILSKSDRESDIMWYHLYVESKKNDTDKLIYKTEIDSQTEKTNLCLPKGIAEVAARDKLGVWD